jgi:transposase-like protein
VAWDSIGLLKDCSAACARVQAVARVEIMSERRIALVHTRILRWVQRCVPEFETIENRYARSIGGSWRCS